MATSSRSVRLNDRQMDRLLRDPDGDVGRFMSRLGGFVTRAGQELADQRLQRRSGAFRGGFTTHTEREAGGLRTRITNSAEHASYLNNGTRPHVIRPRKPGGVLVFTNKAGQIVFAREVHHPGTRPYRILDDALRIGVARAR